MNLSQGHCKPVAINADLIGHGIFMTKESYELFHRYLNKFFHTGDGKKLIRISTEKMVSDFRLCRSVDHC